MGANVSNMPILCDGISVHNEVAAAYTVVSINNYGITSGMPEMFKC